MMPSSTNTAWHDSGHNLDLCTFAEQNLYTAVVSDSLDQLGVRNQAMREYLRPLHTRCTFAGWARTISCADIYHIPDEPHQRAAPGQGARGVSVRARGARGRRAVGLDRRAR